MEIDVRDIPWPLCVIRANEAMLQLAPGEDLAIVAADPDVIHNIVLLLKSQADLKFDETRESQSCRIKVRRSGIEKRRRPKASRGAATGGGKRSE
jgi:TusA-related sulfurtransferase